MANDDTSLNAAAKAEWDTLRAEIATRDSQSFQIMTGSIATTTALLTLFVTLAKDTGLHVAQGTEHTLSLPVALYYIPFAIMLPSVYLVLNNAHASRRIGTYIQTHLEERSQLRWESSLARFFERLKEHYDGKPLLERWGARPFEEAKVMFAVFVALGLLDAAVFYLRGDWSFVSYGQVERVGLLVIPFALFVDAGRRVFGRHCARHIYQDIWSKSQRKKCQAADAPDLHALRSASNQEPRTGH